MQYTSPLFAVATRSFISKVNKDYGKAFMDFDNEAIKTYYGLIEQYALENKSNPIYQQQIAKVIQKYVPKYKEFIRYIQEQQATVRRYLSQCPPHSRYNSERTGRQGAFFNARAGSQCAGSLRGTGQNNG